MEHIKKDNRKGIIFIKIVLWVIAGVLLALLFASIFAFAVMYLWNWLMPDIFGLGQIGYLQALGLIVLARLLVGGWHHGHGKDGKSGFHSHIKDRFSRSTRCNEKDLFEDRGFREFWENGGRETYEDFLKERS